MAVLAVLAMAFAGFAAVAATEQNDATNGDATDDYSGTVISSIPWGGTITTDVPVTLYVQKTMSVDSDLGISGYAFNKRIANFGYKEAEYYMFANVYLAMPLVSGYSGEGVYVAIKQTNNAVIGNEMAADNKYKESASSATVISYFKQADAAKFDFDNDAFSILVPYDGSEVDVTITVYTGATLSGPAGKKVITGTEQTSVSFTLDFSGATTIELLDAAMGSYGTTSAPTSTTGAWYYDAADSETSNLTMNAYTGNVAFWAGQDKNLNVKLIGTSTLSAYTDLNKGGNEVSGVISGYSGKNVTIASNGTSEAKLTVYQLNDESIGLWTKGDLTIGGNANAVTTLNVVGGSFGAFAQTGSNTIAFNNAVVDISGGEKAINTNGGGSVTLTGSTVNAYLNAGSVNGIGTEALFGTKTGTVSLDNTSVLTTQGLLLQKSQGAIQGIVYVVGDYIQTNIGTYYGVAGLFYMGTTELQATSSSSASGGAVGFYVVDGADAYGDHLTYAGKATPVNASDVTTAAGILGKITTPLTSTDAVIKLGAKDASIDVTALMKDPKMASVKNLVFYTEKTANAFTLTTTEAFDISDKTIAVQNGSFTGTVKNGTSMAKFTNLAGEYTILPGSVVIAGVLSGTSVIEVTGTYELAADIAAGANITFKAAEGATDAKVQIISDISIGAGKDPAAAYLNFQDIDVGMDALTVFNNLVAGSTVSFKADATLTTDLNVVGGQLSVSDAQSKDIVLDGVTVTSTLTTTGDLYTLGDPTTFQKAVKVGELYVASQISVAAGTASASNTLTVTGDAEIEITGTVNLADNTKIVFEGITELSGKILYGSNDKAIISNKGTMTVTSTGITGATAITSKAAKNFVNDGILVIKGVVVDLTNNKTVRLYGQIGYLSNPTNPDTTNGKLVNEGTIYVMDAAAEIYTSSTSGKGSIDTSAVSEEVTLSGVLKTTTTFTKYQIVTFTADTTIKETTLLTFQGNAIIPMGVTVTIENGSSMIVSTAFGKLTNNGSLAIEGTFTVDKADVE
ncbi:MAG: hypothetical protein IKQ93_05020, partial [Candidatus Methanomethylophilaceae archaeon]|nr:hypothetical protein [Candidatus Methanomethylophilaceae archaeon]